uniref:Uncharacterized protein n=1 Tax=Glossina pallidipes TaxID=7398 RepID=A0A1B0AGL7_GLOPL
MCRSVKADFGSIPTIGILSLYLGQGSNMDSVTSCGLNKSRAFMAALRPLCTAPDKHPRKQVPAAAEDAHITRLQGVVKGKVSPFHVVIVAKNNCPCNPDCNIRTFAICPLADHRDMLGSIVAAESFHRLRLHLRTVECNENPDARVGLLCVSGSSRESNPPTNAIAPNIIRGKGTQMSASILKNGANIPPIRATIDDAPNPTLRTTVGNCSAEKMYTVP